MAVDVLLPGQVLAEVISAGIRIEADVELVERIEDVVQDDGTVVQVSTIEEVGGLRDAEPGEIIDVTGWAHIGAYVERGQIMLLTTAQAELHNAAKAKAKTTAAKTPRS